MFPLLALLGLALATPAMADDDLPAAGVPQDEASFLVAVTAARSEYNLCQNDMAKGASRLNREKALCSILTGTHIDQWIGKATSLTTNSSGKGIIVVQIAPGVTIETTNNEISDALDHTLLSQDSSVFRQAMTLKEGDTISFSGDFISSDIDCIREMSITLEGSMTEPEFLFHFTSIETPRDASSSPTSTSLTPTTAVPALDRPPAMPQPTGTGPVTMYDKGLADRPAWEHWFNGLLAWCTRRSIAATVMAGSGKI
jgi:hypothetical protein